MSLDSWMKIIEEQGKRSAENRDALNKEADKIIEALNELDEFWYIRLASGSIVVRSETESEKRRAMRALVIQHIMPFIDAGIRAGVVKQ